MNEELQAKIESIKSFDDAYKMACEGGYKGTADEFATLVENAADDIIPMDMDAMENVAGGGVGEFFSNTWDSVTSACGKAVNWVSENPALTAEIAGGVALVGVAIGTSVVAYKSYMRNHNDKSDGRTVQVGGKWYQDQGNGKLVLLTMATCE